MVCAVGALVVAIWAVATAETPPAALITSNLDIRIDAQTWDIMETCTPAHSKTCAEQPDGEYDKPAQCDYQTATCVLTQTGGENPPSHEFDCEVRRKGSVGSWRAMREKPSFKVKFEEKQVLGNYTCGVHLRCSSLANGKLATLSHNVWKTKKVTLNNMVQARGELRAYDAFRDAGLVSPLVEEVNVSLYRGSELIRNEEYAMVETISDKEFMQKYITADKEYILWELPTMTPDSFLYQDFPQVYRTEWKRAGGDDYEDLYEPQCDSCLNEANMTLCGPYNQTSRDVSTELFGAIGLSEYNREHLVRFYAAERSTAHWDGICLNNRNNGYIVFADGNFSYIVSGADQTYQCESVGGLVGPTCSPMVECLEDPECAELYREASAYVRSRVSFTCEEAHSDDRALTWGLVVGLGVVPILALVAYGVTRARAHTNSDSDNAKDPFLQ
jgi:hypothetical protein